MTDRELLELAAKAYWGDEIDDACSIRWLDEDEAIGYTHADNQDHNGRDIEYVWDPLAHDGDALRLAVKLGLTICNDHESAGSVVCTRTDTDDFPAVLSGNPGDPPGITPADYAATRRAIVLASAEIGAAMKTDSVR